MAHLSPGSHAKPTKAHGQLQRNSRMMRLVTLGEVVAECHVHLTAKIRKSSSSRSKPCFRPFLPPEPRGGANALNEFSSLGRTGFLARYGFGKSRDFLVRNPSNGELFDSKAIVGTAFEFQYPGECPLKPADFSDGEATVAPKLQSIGFEVVRIGEDWSQQEIDATVSAYFEMLLLEAKQEKFSKSERNSAVRQVLKERGKASVELKHANISAVPHGMDLPFISGYKPRGTANSCFVKQYRNSFSIEATWFGMWSTRLKK